MRQGSGFGRDWGCAFSHAPPLQEFGDMLTRSIRNRIQSRDGKRICACWYIGLVVCVYLRISVRERINAWLPTRVRSQLTVISYSPGTSVVTHIRAHIDRKREKVKIGWIYLTLYVGITDLQHCLFLPTSRQEFHHRPCTPACICVGSSPICHKNTD